MKAAEVKQIGKAAKKFLQDTGNEPDMEAGLRMALQMLSNIGCNTAFMANAIWSVAALLDDDVFDETDRDTSKQFAEEKQLDYAIRNHFGMRSDVFLFPNEVGFAYYSSKTYETAKGRLLCNPVMAVRYGLKPGSSDLIGLFIYKGKSIFVSFELKAKKGKLSAVQKVWISFMQKCGAIAGVVYSVDDAENLIAEWVKKQEAA